MLACQEEVMVLMEQCAVESDQGLPLFIGELVSRSGLLLVDEAMDAITPHTGRYCVLCRSPSQGR
jgi:hypothetical protein